MIDLKEVIKELRTFRESPPKMAPQFKFKIGDIVSNIINPSIIVVTALPGDEEFEKVFNRALDGGMILGREDYDKYFYARGCSGGEILRLGLRRFEEYELRKGVTR